MFLNLIIIIKFNDLVFNNATTIGILIATTIEVEDAETLS